MAKNSVRTQPISVKIADTVVLQAQRAAIRMLKDYEPIRKKLFNLAGHIYSLAVIAAQLGKNPTYTTAYFKEICKAGESAIKEAAGVDNLKEALPCWVVFKSEINRALACELMPSDFESYSAFVDARKETERKAEEAALEAQTRGRESAQMRTGERAAGSGTEQVSAMSANEDKVPSVKLRAILTVMKGAITGMDEETQDKFAEELATVIAKYAPALQQGAKQKGRKQTKTEQAEQKQEQAGEAAAA